MKKSNNNTTSLKPNKIIILPEKTKLRINPDWSFETIQKALMLVYGIKIVDGYCKRVGDHYYLKEATEEATEWIKSK